MDKCPKCGYEEPIDYFELINKLKDEYTLKVGFEPTHLIISIEEYDKMENCKSVIDRLVYIKFDTTKKIIG